MLGTNQIESDPQMNKKQENKRSEIVPVIM